MIIDWQARPELIEQLKQQSRIDFDDDDQLLIGYAEAALAHVEMHCDRTLVMPVPGVDLAEDQMELTADVWQAVLMLVAHWYSNREAVVVGAAGAELPLGVARLLQYRKRY